jgi:Flp pilus assembly protein TadG
MTMAHVTSTRPRFAGLRLLRDRRGVGVVEFALGLPVFLVLVCGGLEVANLALTQQRLSAIASQTAQNGARGTYQIDEADVRQVFTADELAADQTAILTQGRVILSSVRLNAAGNGQWIEWQRCDGSDTSVTSRYGAEGKGKTDSSLQQVGSAPGLKAVANVDIMVAEAQTRYKPLIGNAFSMVPAGKLLTATAAQVVRDRTPMGIKNDGNLAASQIKSC